MTAALQIQLAYFWLENIEQICQQTRQNLSTAGQAQHLFL